MPPFVHKRILLIEDDLDACEAFRAVLESDGHVVTVAHSGNEGLRLLLRSDPDVVICDLGLPDIDGFDVAVSVRRLVGASPRLIAVSGSGAETDRSRSIESGYDDHFTKPIDVTRVLAHIAALPSRGRASPPHEASGTA